MEPFLDDTDDLSGFDKVCRLFPLPEVVLFPHTVLPLHIFEPRYRQMMEDALASGDKLITMVQLCPPGSPQGLGRPAIEEVACLGRVVRHQRLPDGRFHLVLQGLKRVRLIREIPGDKLYRRAEAEVLEEQGPDQPDDYRRTELVALFLQVVQRSQKLDPKVDAWLETGLPMELLTEVETWLEAGLRLSVLTDVIAHSLNLPASIKQRLLGETRVDRRVDELCEILGDRLGRGDDATTPPRWFPPPFSAN